jgi:hypothetical protein
VVRWVYLLDHVPRVVPIFKTKSIEYCRKLWMYSQFDVISKPQNS